MRKDLCVSLEFFGKIQVFEHTTISSESAYFNPVSIRKTAKRQLQMPLSVLKEELTLLLQHMH
jgi:hypothetical protein